MQIIEIQHKFSIKNVAILQKKRITTFLFDNLTINQSAIF